MPRSDDSSEKLRRHVEPTCLSLRIGIAVIGVLLPVALWVGALFAIGVALYLYRGFSPVENVVLSLAGVLAVCVALFPPQASGERETVQVVHAVAAIGFFAERVLRPPGGEPRSVRSAGCTPWRSRRPMGTGARCVASCPRSSRRA